MEGVERHWIHVSHVLIPFHRWRSIEFLTLCWLCEVDNSRNLSLTSRIEKLRFAFSYRFEDYRQLRPLFPSKFLMKCSRRTAAKMRSDRLTRAKWGGATQQFVNVIPVALGTLLSAVVVATLIQTLHFVSTLHKR